MRVAQRLPRGSGDVVTHQSIWVVRRLEMLVPLVGLGLVLGDFRALAEADALAR